MPARPRNSLLAQIEDLEDPTPKDFDPEDDQPVDSEEEGQSEDSEGEDATTAREHYTSVEKSKLRKPDQTSLGPQYAGSRISRDAALDGDEEDDEDDPFAKGFDFVSSEEESEEDKDNISEAEDMDTDSQGEEDSDDSEDEQLSDVADLHSTLAKPLISDAPISQMVQAARQRESAAATLSRGAEEEKAKGRAVQKQRATFDALLGVRIKLQKALIGGNTLAGLSQDFDKSEANGDDLETAFQAAETAAFSLWSSLTSLREQLNSARAGQKRSHAEFTSDSPTSALWQHMQAQDSSSTASIDTTLERWFSRSHIMEKTSDSRNRVNKAASSTLTAKSIIDSTLADRAHLLKRARTPRSCAPYQLSHRPTSTPATGDPTIYDDADMYAVLLTTLLEQKGSSAVVDVGTTAHAIKRAAKTRRVVDTKASKGRKLRYTVHEKLLNYMAPRDAGTWGERQAEELFSSLFGRRVRLGEEDEGDDEVAEDEEEAEAGLLFGR